MDTNEHIYRGEHAALGFTIVGCAMEVLTELGHGLREKAYENALCVEFGLRNLTVEKQMSFEVFYKGILIDRFIPDLIVEKKVVVDTKVIDRIGDNERGQMLNYLKITKLRVGIILNLRRPKLEWDRLIL